MDNNFKYECELMKQNKYLEERLNCTRESLKRVYQREAIYQSTLQNLKNDLTKFCERIDTTPHSSDQLYREAFYNENKYKNAIEDINNVIEYTSNMSTCYTLSCIKDIVSKTVGDNNGKGD